jgi:hypothetical protein
MELERVEDKPYAVDLTMGSWDFKARQASVKPAYRILHVDVMRHDVQGRLTGLSLHQTRQLCPPKLLIALTIWYSIRPAR